MPPGTACRDQLIAHTARKREVGDPIPVQMPMLPPAQAKLDTPGPVPTDIDLRPGPHHIADPLGCTQLLVSHTSRSQVDINTPGKTPATPIPTDDCCGDPRPMRISAATPSAATLVGVPFVVAHGRRLGAAADARATAAFRRQSRSPACHRSSCLRVRRGTSKQASR